MPTDLDSIVEAYEQARGEGRSDGLRSYLPPADADSYREIALELMRVDLEYGWGTGTPRRLREYVEEFPEVLSQRQALAALAFEEYRLRVAAGERVRREEYVEQYGIDARQWPADEPPAAAPPQFPHPGERLLGFHLVRELGRGAFGRVFLAEQSDLAHRQVAVKVTTEVTVEPERLAQLQHENIVPIYSVHTVDRLQVLCMPYFGDQTLKDWLRARRTPGESSAGSRPNDTAEARHDLTVSTASVPSTPSAAPADAPRGGDNFSGSAPRDRVAQSLQILHGIAAGLAHAHRRGIVHRDLKPANVLLRDDGVPLLLDFNLATDSRTVAMDQGIGGTVAYMSPEQLAALETGAAVDARSDVFACGVLLVEMLTGVRPFAEPSAPRHFKVSAVRDERLAGYRHFQELAKTSSVDVASIAMRCLAPRPEHRYRAADELAEDLRLHLANLPLHYAANRSWKERGVKWLKRHPRLGSSATVATIAALMLLTAMAALSLRGRQVARLDAQHTRDEYLRTSPAIRAALTTPDLDPAIAVEAIGEAEQLLAPYLVESPESWRSGKRVQSLSPTEQAALVADIDDLLQAVVTTRMRLPGEAKTQANLDKWDVLLHSTSESNSAQVDTPALPQARTRTRTALQAGRFPAAVTAAERWVELAPQDYEARYLLGVALVRSGRADEGEQCFSICTVLEPRSAWAFHRRGVCRLGLGLWQGAREDFTRVLALRPGRPDALVNRALARQGLGDLDGAIEDLTAAIATGKSPTRAYFVRAQIYDRQGRPEAAKSDRVQGLSLAPNDAQSWVARGIAKLPVSAEEALRDFQSALQISPLDRDALQNSAAVLSAHLQRPQEAIACLDTLLDSLPNDADARAGRAVLYARLGQTEAALADVAMLRQRPLNPTQRYQVACVHALLGKDSAEQRAAALREFAAACQQDPLIGELAQQDPDVHSIRDEAQFAVILAAARTLREAATPNATAK